jgi:ubiquinone/menaquinone biosynthesis C-methylase UbiE
MSLKGPHTAYDSDKALVYDEVRFTAPGGRLIHVRELDAVRREAGWPSAVAEVGCGTGRLLAEVATPGALAIGIDASWPMLERLAARVDAPDLQLVIAEAARLPFKSQCLPHIYAVRLLNQTESVGYALSVIGEMIRVCQPTGTIQVEFHNWYRLRLPLTKNSSVRLRPSAVRDAITSAGGSVEQVRGAFILSMTAFNRAPSWALPLIDRLDRWLSARLPRLCSRVYVTACGG